MELTKNADKVLCLIYKIYLKRMKDGAEMTEASDFDFNFSNEDKALTKMDDSAVWSAIAELGEAGYIRRYTDGGFRLNQSAVAKMENRFKDGMKELMDFIGSLPIP
jgi:hypothetical protein